MTQIEVLAALAFFVGATLLLSLVRWFGRRSMVERLRPYTPGGMGVDARQGLLSVDSFAEVITPLASSVGQSTARLFGISEELSTKLRRIHSPIDANQYRTRQVGYTLLGLLGAVLVTLSLGLSAPVGFLLTIGTPLLVFLILEQQVVTASEQRQDRLFRELPVVAEQLGMLLAAGYSLGAAMHRVAARGHGVIAEDLEVVLGRMRQGLTEVQALREWAELADVDSLDRLVSVLALDRESSNLGALISDEARAIRREAHRDLLETIERRDQQVWIPVSVAALIPGSILIAVPFIKTLQDLNGG